MMKIAGCGFPGVVSSLSIDGARSGWDASPRRAGGVLWLTGLSGA
ncbi:adenylyl-sulfate kinase, partial [Burkholderia contaminans]